jgi:D-alanine--poly(phosphoribitol) ligase subunit 1
MITNIIEYLDNGAARLYPTRTAIIDGDRAYTFEQLRVETHRYSRAIRSRFSGTNSPIAVFLSKSAHAIFANLAIIRTGNAYTNLDTRSPPQRIRNILDNLNPALVITSDALAPILKKLGVDESGLLLVDKVADDGDIPSYDNSAAAEVIDTDPVCIINTSGSTGTPKGVVLSHRGTIDFMEWVFERFKLDGSERIASLSPIYFDIYTLELNLCLAKGSTLVLVPDQLSTFPAKLIEFLWRQEITFLFWVPSIMVMIANLGLLDKFDLRRLAMVFFAGEVFPTKQLNQWRKALPHAQFVNLYGPIEIHVDCTYFVVDRDFRDDEALPIGFPCRNTSIIILNEDDKLCGTGEHGELCVRGSSLALGYWNDPEKTARAFTLNPLRKHYPDRIYRTGDIAFRQENGEIFLVGRKDFQIKHLGYRIDLQEIEHQMVTMAGIGNACVLYNLQRKEIAVFYELLDETLSPQKIRQSLADIFPKYMLPVVYREMSQLPRNPNGKIDRNGLALELATSR